MSSRLIGDRRIVSIEHQRQGIRMNVRKLRLQRNWSQEQLALLSGLDIRTIQQIERGQAPGLESAKRWPLFLMFMSTHCLRRMT